MTDDIAKIANGLSEAQRELLTAPEGKSTVNVKDVWRLLGGDEALYALILTPTGYAVRQYLMGETK